MYILISIVFIAELIIALSLINLIIKTDRKVCHLNCCVKAFKPLAQTYLQYIRCLVSSFSGNFKKILVFVQKKKDLVIYKTILMVSIYLILIIFKIKFNKATKIYRLISVMRDLAVELTV